MKSLNVRKLQLPDTVALADIPAVLDEAGVEYNPISCDTWKASTHNPKVRFRIAHTSEAIILHFNVKDNEIRAHEAGDDGRIWEDSCCEFFLSPDSDIHYYNFECNCIGRLLLHYGINKPATRPNAPKEAYSAVKRWSSLGVAPFEATKGEKEWNLVEIIPVQALFEHDIDCLDGRIMRANFYKCADLVSEPHFLSWAPIDLPQPCFHCPDFFGELIFEA